jgi:hypothetical protein
MSRVTNAAQDAGTAEAVETKISGIGGDLSMNVLRAALAAFPCTIETLRAGA